MTKKAKGPAEAATSPSQVQTPDKGHKNMQSNIMELSAGATEFPEQRIHRLAKEMSFLLDGFDDYSVVLIFPSKSREYPIHICLDRDFADLMQHAIKYREDA